MGARTDKAVGKCKCPCGAVGECAPHPTDPALSAFRCRACGRAADVNAVPVVATVERETGAELTWA
jgi:hypothetical protein